VHSLVRRYIKTAIVFLFVGLAIGGWMITQREREHRSPSEFVVSAHTHALFVGFVMTMILGVALWLFPRPDKADTRYRPVLAAAAYYLLTTGTAARIAGELARSTNDSLWLRVGVLLAGWLQIVGLVVFFYTMWSRIRGIGSAAREAKGERF